MLNRRIEEHIQTLAEITSTPGKGVTRVVYTQEDVRAKDYLNKQMKELSLVVEEDQIGNIFGTWKGENPDLPQLWTGSHIDAPTNGGKFDGVVGVIGALEAIRSLKESGYMPKRDIVMVIFATEEPTRFGVGCIGSRGLTGMIGDQELDSWKDDDGSSLREVLLHAGRNPEKVLTEQLEPERISAFIELHIEQGPVLENEQLAIGIVDSIAAPTEIRLSIYGEQRHAGSTPMTVRKDPVPAASEIVLAVEAIVKNVSSASVGTVGKIDITPGASNVIAEKVDLTIDIRDVRKDTKDRIVSKLKESVEGITKNRGLFYKWEMKVDDVPAQMNSENVSVLEEIVKESGMPYKIMPSGAYHDALIMSQKVPANMIFIPSKKGISHAPDEFTSTEEIAKGVEVLAKALKRLSK